MLRPSLAGLVLAFASILPAQNCVTTLFTSNNGGSVGGAVFFDINVTSSVLVQYLDTNYSAAIGTPVGMDIWITPGTSIGNQTNQALWTLSATDNGTSTSAGTNAPTRITLASPLLLGAGSHGVALIARGSGHRYTNGNGTNQNFSDAFIALSLGTALNVPWTGTPFNPRVWNGTLCYLPASGLYPNFSGTPRSGTDPLAVQFTDQTYTSDPNGVLGWSWDFNGDALPDSTAQNPSFTYLTEGSFNVTLTAFDAQHGQASITKNAYIQVGFVDASFTTSVLSGTTILFTDTSTGGPTSWAWDFENDGIVDSTLQNAIHTYPAAGQYTCKLTVTDAISTDTVTVPLGIGIIPLPAFGRTYTAAGATRGLWFQSPIRFSIVSLKVPDESNHGLQNVAVYRMAAAPPAYAGNASGGLELFQAGVPSASNIPCVLSFDTGEFVGVLGACGDATTMRTSYATPVGPYLSSIFGNPVSLTRFLTQTNIVAQSGNGAYSSEAAFEVGRVVMGVSAAVGLKYDLGSASGTGAPAPTLKTTALPILGQTAQLTIDQQDVNVFGFVVLGFGRANVPTPFGTLLVNPIVYSDLLNGGGLMGPGQFTYSFNIPLDPALNGAGPANWQNINFVTGPGAFSMSNGQEWWLASN